MLSVRSGRSQEPVGEPGGAGAAAGLVHQHGRHPADGEGQAANASAGVQEGAGRPPDAAGGPGPEDLQLEGEAQRPGRDGTSTASDRKVIDRRSLPTIDLIFTRAGGR